jgi:hypothetical protein
MVAVILFAPGATVMFVVAVFSWKVAEIVTVPAATAVTRPPDTVATEGLDDCHIAGTVWVLPSANRAVASNCSV